MSQANNAEPQAPTVWFSRSKTRAPKFSIPLVERKRLLLALDDALDKPISCIVAPAGFGKTTLLSQWRDSLIARDIPCAWLNVDENDSEIRQFFAYLVLAFEDAGMSFGYLKDAAENGFVDMSSTAITTSLLSAIIDIEDYMVLVLDDYHRVACDEIDKFVGILSDQCGDKVHIAIGSRTSVNVNLPTLLVAGQAIEIPSADLRFSDREVREAMGSQLDQEAIDALQAHVEGWPVAVQMTRLLGEASDSEPMASREYKVTSQGHLADYLVTNVLESQTEELREFLLETCILHSFNSELTNAVCGHDKSQALIRQLNSLQALVVPLDDDFEWFRYHHLFSECLRDLLEQRDPNNFVELHRRAAKWCSENRLIAEAVNYANTIKDYDLSKQIINDNCEWMRGQRFGGVGYLKGLLANIPEQEVKKDIRTSFSKGYAYLLDGNLRKAVHYNSIANSMIENGEITPEIVRDRLTVGGTIIARVGFGAERGGGWLNDWLQQAEIIAQTNPKARYLCASIRNSLAGQSASYGEFGKAREHALAAEADVEQTEIRLVATYMQLTMGVIEMWTNNLNEARLRFKTAADDAMAFGGDQSNLNIVSDVFLRAIDYWQSDIDSKPSLQLAESVVRTVEAEGWFDVYTIGLDAVVHDAICRNDFEMADQLVGKLEKANYRLATARLTEFADSLRLDYHVACGNFAEAAVVFEKVKSWLEAAEKERDDLGWFVRTSGTYACAKFLAASNQLYDSLAYIDQGIADVDPIDVVLFRVRGRILMAMVLEKQGNRMQGIAVLVQAIEDAARTNCLRAFADNVSDALLADAVSSVLSKTKSNAVKEFAFRLTIAGAQKLLSSREEEVLQGIAQGKSNKEIARDLDLTDNTIKFHLRNIYRKLGVKKRVPAVEKARELGILL